MAVKKKATPKPAAPGLVGKQNANVYLDNGTPDGRMFRGLPWAGPISRGYVTEHSPSGKNRVNFMYNPNLITYGFELNAALKAADQMSPQALIMPGIPGGNTMSFDLLFSRQFEVAYGGDKQGVWRDIEALKRITGVRVNQGYMLQKTLMFVMGADPTMVYYGSIRSLQVQIGYFSEKMVPMYASVSISVLYIPPGADPSATVSSVPGTVSSTQAAALAKPAINAAPPVGGVRPSVGPARPTGVL